MTQSDDIKTIVAKFTKVAEDMMNTANDQSSGTISPDEAQEALGVVVDELKAIIDAIPGEGAVSEETEAPAETAQPSEDSQKVSQLEKTVKDLTDKLDLKEREEIAEDFASLHDASLHDVKVKEVMDSKDSNEVWATKINAIDEFESNKTDTPYRKVAQIPSRTKIAQTRNLFYL